MSKAYINKRGQRVEVVKSLNADIWVIRTTSLSGCKQWHCYWVATLEQAEAELAHCAKYGGWTEVES